MIVFGIIIVIIGSVIPDLFHLLIGDASGTGFFDTGSYDEIRIGSHKALLKVIDKLLHILVTSVGGFLAALKDNILERIGNLGNKFPGRGHLLLNMLYRNRNRGLSVKRNSSGQHFKHSNTE